MALLEQFASTGEIVLGFGAGGSRLSQQVARGADFRRPGTGGGIVKLGRCGGKLGLGGGERGGGVGVIEPESDLAGRDGVTLTQTGFKNPARHVRRQRNEIALGIAMQARFDRR